MEKDYEQKCKQLKDRVDNFIIREKNKAKKKVKEQYKNKLVTTKIKDY